MTYKIVLTEDWPEIRESIKRILAERGDLAVVGEAGDGMELLEYLRCCPALPDMVLLDLSMPGMGGMETMKRLREAYPEIKVLILTVHNEREIADRVLAAGADGYVVKEDAVEELLPAIDRIRKGRRYISSSLNSGFGRPA
jgi:two-component system response regulator NreC